MNPLLQQFFSQYFALNPVNATFTGMHGYDELLPMWSRANRAEAARMRGDMHGAFDRAYPMLPEPTALRASNDLLDSVLARAYLDIRDAEDESRHFIDKNPALWTGEAIFGAVSLMLRPFAPRSVRMQSLTGRLGAVPRFLGDMREVMPKQIPARWLARAQKECRVAAELFSTGLEQWIALEPADERPLMALRGSAARACTAFRDCEQWLGTLTQSVEGEYACGARLYELLLRRGHFSAFGSVHMLEEATEAMKPAKARLAALTQDVGADPVPASDKYMDTFQQTWDACHAISQSNDLVEWPDWPIRYVPFPEWARAAAPQLYWLFYRSPAPLDPYSVHDYLVNPGWSESTIKLNHVVHHGALGHHVQNWHSQHRSRTEVGKISAVDCANRIGMFLGGSFAEGWACYAVELMDELGFLTPTERVAQQQTRVRMLARAIVDIRLHTKGMTTADAVRYYVDEVGMSADAAEGEVTKNTMFPCTALMYWLGTKTLLDLRATIQDRRGAAFSARAFHDEMLSYGAMPALLIKRLMTDGVP